MSLSLRSSLLSSTPLALNYAVIAAITLFAGWRAGTLTVLATALTVNHTVFAHHVGFALDVSSLLRTAFILGVGLLVMALCQRQRSISSCLSHTLGSLQARTDALNEAQQGGNSVAWTMDLTAKTIQWAEGGSPIFGRPFPELSSLDTVLDLIPETDRIALAQAAKNAMRSSQPFDGEFRVRWPDGELHWIATRGTPAPHQAKLWRGVSIDVTDRKLAELALLRSEKLAAIGRLSATVAHEINNPLEAVTNLLYLAQSDNSLSPETRRHLEQADQELARLASIARHTLTFAHPRPIGPARIGDALEDVSRMFQPKCYARGANLRILGDESLLVAMPPEDLRQILTNLLSNACDALPSTGGLIEIDFNREHHNANITIRDNGSGVDPSHLDHIFDPFFTTKSDIGTGIGLWVSRELVHKNGGQISLHTHGLPTGFRTLFRVQIPLASPAESPQKASPGSVHTQSGASLSA